jgi:hypothetical protein
MTPEQKWALCCKQARRIVRNHRKQIPSGHDYFLSWVVAGVTVATAVAGGVKSHNDAKDAAGQAEAQRKAGLKNKLPAFEPPPLPGYVPFNFNGVQKDAVQADKDYYARSDADFLRRHPSLVQAERIFEDRTLKDQKGDSELLPAIQNELMRAGLEGSLNAFGSTGANLRAELEYFRGVVSAPRDRHERRRPCAFGPLGHHQPKRLQREQLRGGSRGLRKELRDQRREPKRSNQVEQ